MDEISQQTQKLESINDAQRSLVRALRTVTEGARFRERPDLAPFVNWGGNATSPIHRWLRYREAYSPNLITKLGLGARILDPFCGCGSILVGAAQSGNTSAGVDINPLAVFAAKVKLTPLTRGQLEAIQQFVVRLPEFVRSVDPWPVPALSVSCKVFEPEILDTLLRIRSSIESGFENDEECRNFLHLAWIAILERVGSYFKEGNGIKYRNRKRLKTGYVHRKEGEWQLERFGDNQQQFVLDSFSEHACMMLQDTKHWRKGRWRSQQVIQGNVLELEDLLPRRKFDSIVFSPPYANRFDYFESMKVELWFGGFVESYESNNQLRKASLRSHLGADLNRGHKLIPELESLIELMDQGASSYRMGVPDLLRGYFDDMRSTLAACRNLIEEGSCHVVVGNSAFAGVIIPTDVLIAQIGLSVGFKKAELLVTRHLTVAPQQRRQLSSMQDHMRESVVVLS